MEEEVGIILKKKKKLKTDKLLASTIINLQKYDSNKKKSFSKNKTHIYIKGKLLKLVNQFPYHSSYISSTESNVNICITKTLTVIDRWSIIWKFDLSNKTKRDFFQSVAVLVLLCGCTTWTHKKMLAKKLEGNFPRMLLAVLKNPGRSKPAKQYRVYLFSLECILIVLYIMC